MEGEETCTFKDSLCLFPEINFQMQKSRTKREMEEEEEEDRSCLAKERQGAGMRIT